MFPNVEGAKARNKVTLEMLARDPRIDCTVSTMSQKLNGKAPLTFKEALAIKDILGSELTLEELFKEGD